MMVCVSYITVSHTTERHILTNTSLPAFKLHGPTMLVDKTTERHILTNTSLPAFKLHGPTMLVDETCFGLVLYNHDSFYGFEKSFSNWSVKLISVFLCFSLVSQLHTSIITVYNCTVT